MTPRCGVRAALTEERSKAEIKTSALRCRDETKSFYPHQKQSRIVIDCKRFFASTDLFCYVDKFFCA